MRLLQSERNETVRTLRDRRGDSQASEGEYAALRFRVRHRNLLHWAVLGTVYVGLAALSLWAVLAWL